MKHLRETFTDQEFLELQKAKQFSQLNWHDFLLHAAQVYLHSQSKLVLDANEEVKTE